MNPLVIRNVLPADAQNISALIHGEAYYCFGEVDHTFYAQHDNVSI